MSLTSTPDKTANWQLYRNGEWGFEFTSTGPNPVQEAFFPTRPAKNCSKSASFLFGKKNFHKNSVICVGDLNPAQPVNWQANGKSISNLIPES